jgi:drug/metabolite transporter (DMT)-like permease
MLPLTGRSLKPPPWRVALGVGLFQGAGMTGLSQLALVTGGAGKTAVLVYTMPFWVMALAALLLNEKPRPSQYVAAVIAACGLLLVIQPWQWHGTLLSSILAVASGAAWAAGSVLAKRAFRDAPIDLLSLTAWQMVIGAVVLSALALATHQTPIVWSTDMVLALGYNAVLATALGWVLWLFILRTLPAGIAGLSALMIPVMSVLWALWLLGEKPDLAESGGITLIVLALALMSGAGPLRAALRRLLA